MLYRPSRRRFWRALATGSLIGAINAIAPRQVSPYAPRATTFNQLGSLDGDLATDPETLRAYAADWGGIIHEVPRAVLRPGSVQDISRMVVFARRAGMRVAVRGHGHQPFGQAQVLDGLVVDLRSLQRVHTVSPTQVEVDAGADWHAVLAAALAQDVVPPVLTNYLGLTVGGTLSVGGVGPATFRRGAQVDHVDELQVVTGEGRQVTCSSTRHRALFEAALAGQGQCAIITRAVLRLIPAPQSVREYLLPYSDLERLLGDGVRLSGDDRFIGMKAAIAPGGSAQSYALTIFSAASDAGEDGAVLKGLHHVPGSEQARNLPFPDYAKGLQELPSGSSHADLAVCLPASAARAFLEETMPRLTGDDLGAATAISVFFWQRKLFRAPLFRVPDADDLVYLLILRQETNDANEVGRMLHGNRVLFERARDCGGTLYPYSAVELMRRDWKRHYGEAWDGLLQAKRRYDFARVLASGPGAL